MPIQRAKPLDNLYDEVADYDLVLVPDAPLASALERRLDRPQFGPFATTPRRLAAGRREQAEDRTAFLDVVDRTDHGWKAVSYAVGNVLQCWEHHGRLRAILEYDAYADDVTEDVVEAVAGLETTSKRLTEYEIEAESVAVVGEEQLTALERSILPTTYDRIDLFTDEPFQRPPFHVFDSATDVVNAILDTVAGSNGAPVDSGNAADGSDDDAVVGSDATDDAAENVAIVLDAGSRYASLVESALEAADVPYYGGPGFVDEPHHRCFLRLCRTAFRGTATTVADVTAVLAQCGTALGVDHDRKRLDAAALPETAWIREFCDALDTRTFAEAVAAYEAASGADLDRFREELDALGLADRLVDEARVDRLAYYLQTYEVPVERENEGVLLADAKSSGYVDRPVVFHVGLDEGWTHSAPQRPWVDAETQFQRSLGQFQLLLQSGVEQYYLVQDAAGGQPVTPCLYFGDLLDESFERFSDLDAVSHTGTALEHTTPTGDRGDEAGFEREPVAATDDRPRGPDPSPEPVRTVSNTSLTTFVNCPRDYLFDRLLDGPDRDYFEEGTLFHDFAEFYVNHPEFVDETVIEDVVALLLERVGPFFDESDRPLRRRTYRLGLETIAEFLEERGPASEAFLTPTSGWGTNAVAEHFDRDVDSPLTERWFEDEDLGLKGKIDLVRSPTQLVDYKSGSKQSRRDVVRQAAIDPPDDAPNYQAAIYLCHLRAERPDEPLEFTFFHFLETLDDLVAGDHDLEDALTTVSYYPWTFDEHVATREAYETLLDGWNDCAATFEALGFERYEAIASELSFPETTDRDELRESAFATVFTDAVTGATPDDVDAEKGVDQAIRLLNRVRKKAFFRDDLDAFEAFVEEQLAALNRYRSGEERFPIDGPGDEPNYRRVDHRDLLLEGQR